MCSFLPPFLLAPALRMQNKYLCISWPFLSFAISLCWLALCWLVPPPQRLAKCFLDEIVERINMKIEKLLQFVCLQFCFCGCFAVFFFFFSPPERCSHKHTDTCVSWICMSARQTETETVTATATVMNEYFLHIWEHEYFSRNLFDNIP